MKNTPKTCLRDSKHPGDPVLGPTSIRASNPRCLPIAIYVLYGLLSLVFSVAILGSFGFLSETKDFPIRPNTTSAPFDWKKVHSISKLRWVTCGLKRECARLEVPFDYSDPTGEKAAIALLRIKAKVAPESEEYRGPILFNPGGPGGSGVTFIDSLGEEFRNMLGVEYDIVGFDPRGVGQTTPQISNFDDAFERAYWDSGAPPLTNSTPDALPRAYARSQLFGELADARTKHAAQHASTAVVARDMLAITKAHGREKLLYWGFSYGTVLGATYAAMFPENIERLIIDGVVDLEDYYTGRWYSNLHDTDNILQLFYDECAAVGMACPLYANSSELVQQRGSDYAIIDYTALKTGLFVSLYQPFVLLRPYAFALAALEKGDGLPALAFGKVFRQWPKCSSPLPFALPAKKEATLAIACGESQGAGRDMTDITRHFKELSELSVFADVWTDTIRVGCSGWKTKAKERYAGPFNTSTSFPLLVIGNTADPVTPLRGAAKVASGFKNASLLTVNTPGHCSLAGTSICTTKHIRNYFRSGELPKKSTVCEIENTIFGKAMAGVKALNEEDQRLLEVTRTLSQRFHTSRERYLL